MRRRQGINRVINVPSPTDRSAADSSERNGRKPYTPPALIHEAQMETRAGTPLPFAGDPTLMGNPWDPDYGVDGSQ